MQAALDKVGLALLDEHARHCVLGASFGDRVMRRGSSGANVALETEHEPQGIVDRTQLGRLETTR